MQKETINSMLLAVQQQFYDYALQLRLNGSLTSDPYALYTFYQQFEPRFREQPKPSHSYIGLIAMAILSSPERQLVLADIYQWILDRYPYFRSRGVGWRNSIRHNLSLNECFVKAGRSTSGKGHYWTIHPANLQDFLSGDFRRRRAQRRVRQSMNLPEPEGDEEDDDEIGEILPVNEIKPSSSKLPHLFPSSTNSTVVHYLNCLPQSFHANQTPRKRCFDVDSLLAPDQPKRRRYHSDKNDSICSPNSKSDSSTNVEIFSQNHLY